ncbi:hypothetical protein VTN00DRAFT_4212 [Thermoascus crustaceus]|uniref:uncharacterized protein n=1 Tax=Thermoascus crustaceus TaxID=5088 RepID=UPI003742D619
MDLDIPGLSPNGLFQQPAPDHDGQTTTTDSKTRLAGATEPPRRRQHRSCDQCRKGKRACDAEITVKSHGLESPPSSNASGSPGRTVSAVGPCSNCIRWRRECTFEWLRSVQTRTVQRRRKKAKVAENQKEKQCMEAASSPHAALSSQPPLAAGLASSQPGAEFPGNGDLSLGGSDPSGTLLSQVPDLQGFSDLGSNAGSYLGPGSAGTPWEAHIPGRPRAPALGDIDGLLDSQDVLFDWIPQHSNNISIPAGMATKMNASSTLNNVNFNLYSPSGGGFAGSNEQIHPPLSLSPGSLPRQKDSNANRPSISSQNLNLAQNYARFTLTQNLLRIYHDSMENALSCWLTERTCPYSSVLRQSIRGTRSFRQISTSPEAEWGPNWSNRICTRVCRLDRAYSTIRGRNLTATEERAVSRALHTTIMAFATQWAQASDRSRRRDGSSNLSGMNGIPSQSTNDSERSVQETLWNQAFHALNDAAGIESFRVVFAHIIFSLTQRPLNVAQHLEIMNARRGRGCNCQRDTKDLNYSYQDAGCQRCSDRASAGLAELHELFDSDKAPLFLETAVRQMFFYRHKLTRLQRQIATKRDSKKGYNMSGSSIFPLPSPPPQCGREPAEPRANLLNQDDYETFHLLFWLGVMFDTLTAAMYQRPLVVSDEDSAITSAIPEEEHQPNNLKEDAIDLDGWNLASNMSQSSNTPREQDLWGDLFLLLNNSRGVPGGQQQPWLNCKIPRWPCSYPEAAETLIDAAPIKVLLFRRVTRLQTLVYRGAGPDKIEEAIEDTLRVYQHWNSTFGLFILDCVAHHDDLPPRLQSWYVILAGHWHLAAMLMADVLEGIDDAGIGVESKSEARRASRLVAALKRENAFAVADLARRSMQGQTHDTSFSRAREFHHAVNGRAFLTEPWTAVLIRSFARAGYILVDLLDTDGSKPVQQNIPTVFPSKEAAAAVATASEKDESRIKARCISCVDALWCLSKKSDMAFLAARALSNSLEERIRQRQRQERQQRSQDPSLQGSDHYEYGSVPRNGNGKANINDGLYFPDLDAGLDPIPLGQIPLVGSLSG